MPLMSCGVRPASSSASFARSAHCSIVNFFGPVYLRSCLYSANPTTAASPRRPISAGPSDGTAMIDCKGRMPPDGDVAAQPTQPRSRDESLDHSTRQVLLGKRRPGRFRSTAERSRKQRRQTNDPLDARAGLNAHERSSPATPCGRARPPNSYERDFEIPKDHIQFDHRVYDASLETLLRVVREVPTDCPSVALVGHNPGRPN